MLLTTVVTFVLLLSDLFLIDARILPLQNAGSQLRITDVVNRGSASVALTNKVHVKGWDDWIDWDDLDETLPGPPEPDTEVCYPVVGCFDNNPPFDYAGLEVPQAPSLINTSFILFTKSTPNNPEFLKYNQNDNSIINSRYNRSNWLRIIVHGFTNSRSTPWISRMTEELLKLTGDETSDVLVVDWGNGAKFPLYNKAAANTRLVGKELSLLLKKMKTLKQLDYNKVHCIGHSLGAHTCGYASVEINRQMGRISGLDPAGPFFEGAAIAVRLDQGDATFVDVIHTNTELALSIGLGTDDPSGHADFYVNGGKQQPGCPSVGVLVSGLFSGQNASSFDRASCSHSRAIDYFTESIHSPCPYTSFICQDYNNFRSGACLTCSSSGCGRMGFRAIDAIPRGNMYLATRSSAPFCGYHYYTELVLDQSAPKTIGEVYVAVYSNDEMLANVSMTHKANVDIKPGSTFRHVFSLSTDLNNIDYAIVYFTKGKTLFNIGGPFANEIIISRLRIRSIENTLRFSATCDGNVIVPAHTEHKMTLNGLDCDK